MRLLLVTTRFPLPPWRGQQVRTVEWLDALREHDRCLVCPEPAHASCEDTGRLAGVDVRCHPRRPLSTVWSGIRGGVGGLPVQESIYYTPAALDAVRDALRTHRPDAVVVQMVRCGWALDLVASLAPDVPVLFDAIDAMGLHYERAASGFPLFVRPAASIEANRCRSREREIAQRSELTVAVSARDLESIEAGSGRGVVIPVSGRTPHVERRPAAVPTVLLSGNLGYRPTVAAVLWFAGNVWPEVRRRFPKCRWVLAGARPPRVVRDLASSPGVEVFPGVPDLGPYLAESWVAVAPMASGSGVPMKILEAWAAEVPVIANPWTAGGVEEHTRSALVQAESAAEWVEAISGLLGDERARLELAVRGRDAWRECYHPDLVAVLIRQAVHGLGSGRLLA